MEEYSCIVPKKLSVYYARRMGAKQPNLFAGSITSPSKPFIGGKKSGDMDLADAKRLGVLEKENAELKKMLLN